MLPSLTLIELEIEENIDSKYLPYQDLFDVENLIAVAGRIWWYPAKCRVRKLVIYQTAMKTVPAIVQLLFAAALIGQGCMADDVQTVEDFNRLLVGSDLSNDFENGTLGLWNNTGLGSVRWQVEDNSTLIEPGYPAPIPDGGEKYLRINHSTPGLTANFSSGLAVLKSPLFTAQPGDLVSFSFWIRSKNYKGNSLVVNNNWFMYLYCLIISSSYYFF